MLMSAYQLQQIRANQVRAMPSTCHVWRPSLTLEATGGWRTTWLMVGVYPCRLTPENTRRALETVGEKQAEGSFFRLSLPYDADLRPHDRADVDGASYHVLILWAQGTPHLTTRALVVTGN